MLSDDPDRPISDADLVASVTRAWAPPSIDDPCPFGKHKGLSYRAMAARDPGYARWVASTIPGIKGQLAAEALAAHLGVTE